MADKKYFYTTAFFAVLIYIFFVLALFLHLKTKDVKKISAKSKTTVLQLDVVIQTPQKSEQKSQIKEVIQNKKIAKEVVKKTASTSLKKKSNLKSLFANVKTKAKKVSKKRVSTVKQSSISSRFKSKFEKERKVKKVVVPQLEKSSSNNARKATLTKSDNETDPYFSKIYEMLHLRWSPTIYSINLEAIVLVTITNNGIFSFKFIQYSDNIGFDNQLEEFLNGESLKTYPVNPNNKTTQMKITFKSKEQDV